MLCPSLAPMQCASWSPRMLAGASSRAISCVKPIVEPLPPRMTLRDDRRAVQTLAQKSMCRRSFQWNVRNRSPLVGGLRIVAMLGAVSSAGCRGGSPNSTCVYLVHGMRL
ncbi:hypothetical protein OBBRIDRAFT_132331 [Obba rivulosa]|uniref:Uncharacterized protein n=1 Tax=Obba rivulosa TaxID=1052685 RepID=A0A8E2DI58_9APHY|nr:hypothetical protein OBBRIDRAFT_132331 [Obba rivulosa]